MHTSSVVAVGLSTDGKPCDETATWNFDSEGLLDAYAITKHEAEDVVHAARDRLDAVIVNPTYMFGPRDARPSSGKLIIEVVKRRVPGWTPGYNNFVDVRDVARGMIAAWQKGRRGERYILGGHDMTYRDVLRDDRARRRRRSRRGSASRTPVAKLVGKCGDLVERARQGADRELDADPLRVHRSVPVHERRRPRASSATRTARSSPRSATRSRGSARHAHALSVAALAPSGTALPRVIRPRKPSRSFARTTERSRSTA